jgi:hypothetical protein
MTEEGLLSEQEALIEMESRMSANEQEYLDLDNELTKTDRSYFESNRHFPTKEQYLIQ